ncbi:uncharacterized protein THITE_2108666 [Thermothielavioides terrestris NRRL 8126]|uniref:Telomeric single stranded DNA binding POT1/Cdc13 domain-containing protein n=1 Tax=Thermothielavioides terrestris (strain ATCC 38088 / NRRL 8126) TaxID=578455 RepID=G2QS37_THETT|nr:uncharacterized protein THITE_2108666 [Thermothielavioides terrestris NRRL 8126]AEO63427.1 hypothetical protein THITE_2108666 [Thermothielavioides terrestris NRRL 8126]
MAPVGGDHTATALLASRPVTPIAELNPDLLDQASRVVRGNVTITWPYNSVTKTLAFLLAESDVRLRRARGQIRIELRGPSAAAASECGLGAGDELLLGLDGAHWAKDVSRGRIPGARVDWQLQFSEKLILQVTSSETGETKHITIDHPASDVLDGPVAEPPRAATPEPAPRVPDVQSAVHQISDIPLNEYASPAFMKRARLSYGALFEGGFDIFEEDGGVKGRGRKRARFGRDSSAWRYSSQSPSPEPPLPIDDAVDEVLSVDGTPQPSPNPQVVDEGCQTGDVEMEAPAPEPGQPAVSQGEAVHVPTEHQPLVPHRSPTLPVQNELASAHQPRQGSATPAAQEEPVPSSREAFAPISKAASTAESREQPANEPDQVEQARESPVAKASQPSPPHQEKTPSMLFGGPRPLGSNFSMFGAGAPAQLESTLSLTDQVRFGFSHVPQTTRSPSPPEPEPVPAQQHRREDPYPTSYLDETPASATYADMNTRDDAADEQAELAGRGQSEPPKPPAVESFAQGQWEMSTQPPGYNQIEGGHFGADALEEGARVASEQASLHADSTAPEAVPEGFASYGGAHVPDQHQESPPPQASPHEEQPFVENEDTVSGDEVGVDDEEDAEAESDEDAYGERIEEGDYDQRNYDMPSDDDEGLSEQDDEIELEAEERDGNGEAYDEDDEGEEWDEDEDEEDYESEEEDYEDDYDTRGYQPRKPAAPAPKGEPVVISLLSDSEDEEEEPAPAPKEPAAASPPVAAQHAPEGLSTSRSPEDAGSSSPEDAGSRSPEDAGSRSPEDAGSRSPEDAGSRSPADPGSPEVLKSVETDKTNKGPASNIFNQTHVIDFAVGLDKGQGVSQPPRAPPADLGSDTAPSSFSSKVTGSFEVSNAREGSAPVSEPAQSEGSSEGLFVSQPRARSRDAEDERTEGSLNDEYEDTHAESTDMERESVPEQVGPEDVVASVEVEEDEVASLPDADNASLASQVEMDEDLAESEDDYMSVDEAAYVTDVAMGSEGSSLEVEEVAGSEEDVHMIDVSSPLVESASPEMMDVQEPPQASPAVFSDFAVSEVVSEAAISTAADEPPPTAQIPAPQDAQQASSYAATEQELAAVEQLQKTLAESPGGSPEAREAKADTEEPAEAGRNAPHASELETGVASPPLELQEPAEELETQARTEIAVTPPAQPLQHGTVIDVEIEEAREESVVPDSSLAPPMPTVAKLDLPSSDEQPAPTRSFPTPRKEAQAIALPEGSSAPQTPEPDSVHRSPPATAEDDEDEALIQEQLTQELQQSFEAEMAEAHAHIPSPTATGDLSINLARQAVAAKRQKTAEAQAHPPSPTTTADLSVNLARQAVASKRQKKAPEPIRTSPPVTRARSSSLRSNATPEREDNSVSLARAALASPSRQDAEADGTGSGTSTSPGISTNPATTMTTTTAAALKSELAKRLRTDLPECVPLKSLRVHVDKQPNAIAVVTSRPSAPARAKGGPREYFMAFRVTDPSVAPAQVVEVQLYRPHKDSLPVVKPGDVVLLQRFQVKALTRKGFGLRTDAESAWAVWDSPPDADGGGQAAAPQIRGPPVEDWQGCVEYVRMLKEWFALLVGDAATRGKLERADRKMEEAGGGKS